MKKSAAKQGAGPSVRTELPRSSFARIRIVDPAVKPTRFSVREIRNAVRDYYRRQVSSM